MAVSNASTTFLSVSGVNGRLVGVLAMLTMFLLDV